MSRAAADPRSRRSPVGFPGIVLAWTLLALLVTTQSHLRTRELEAPVPWLWLLAFQLAYWYGWAAITPLVFALGRRFPFDGVNVAWRAALHLAVGIVASIGLLAYFSALMVWFGAEPGTGAPSTYLQVFERYMTIGFHYDVLTYAAVLAAGLAVDAQAKFRDRSLRAAQLETRLIEARFAALRMQLQPHFLFNTLHAISTLVDADPAAARAMIARLSELLRMTLQRGDRPVVALREELELVESYLAIEAVRFEDRLTVVTSIDPPCEDALVPCLLLQPLVENAVRHGIERGAAAGRIELTARRRDGILELTVCDDGPGAEPGALREGIGLTNVRERLAQLHGDRARLEVAGGETRGFEVRIELPFETEGASR